MLNHIISPPDYQGGEQYNIDALMVLQNILELRRVDDGLLLRNTANVMNYLTCI